MGKKTKTKPKHETQTDITRCHDDASQNFPPGVGRREVVRQLAELVHDETRDGVRQNLRDEAARHGGKTMNVHKKMCFQNYL